MSWHDVDMMGRTHVSRGRCRCQTIIMRFDSLFSVSPLTELCVLDVVYRYMTFGCPSQYQERWMINAANTSQSQQIISLTLLSMGILGRACDSETQVHVNTAAQVFMWWHKVTSELRSRWFWKFANPSIPEILNPCSMSDLCKKIDLAFSMVFARLWGR